MADALAQETPGCTREEYLALEEQAEYKSEYYNGEVVAMAGGSHRHSIICGNMIQRIGEAVEQKDCIRFDSNLKLQIPRYNLFVYPDLMVVCGRIEFFAERGDTITNPALIVEVLSPATHGFDRGEKFRYYRNVPSMREYVLVSQAEPLVEAFYRQDEKVWLYTPASGLDETITLHTLEREFALRDIYQKIEWE